MWCLARGSIYAGVVDMNIHHYYGMMVVLSALVVLTNASVSVAPPNVVTHSPPTHSALLPRPTTGAAVCNGILQCWLASLSFKLPDISYDEHSIKFSMTAARVVALLTMCCRCYKPRMHRHHPYFVGFVDPGPLHNAETRFLRAFRVSRRLAGGFTLL